jgi:hypothetical protein
MICLKLRRLARPTRSARLQTTLILRPVGARSPQGEFRHAGQHPLGVAPSVTNTMRDTSDLRQRAFVPSSASGASILVAASASLAVPLRRGEPSSSIIFRGRDRYRAEHGY